ELISKRFGQMPRYEYKVKDKKAAKQYKRLINPGGTSAAALRKAFALRVKAYDEDIVDGALSKLVMKPNDYQGQDQFFQAVAIQYELFGECFIWKNRGINENGEPLELHVLPANYVDVVPDETDVWGVSGYIFKVSGSELGLRKEDVIHWKNNNPNFDAVTREHLRGQSPLKAGLKLLQQDIDATDASVAMFQNGGARGVLFNKTLNNLSPEQQTQLQNVINRKLNAGAVKSAIATLQGDWGYADFGLSSVDMELLKAAQSTTEKLCNLFSVPPELFISGQTYENKNQARKDFLTNKVIPMCAAFDDELNRSLGKDFKSSNTTLQTEYDNEPELQEDIEKLIEYSAKLFDRGVINGNEFRKLSNYEESSEPMHNQFLIAGNYTPLQDLDLANQEAMIDDYDSSGKIN
ncbi:MAG: phage portal protein, partial [Sphingobacteriales bacterium]